MTEKVAYPMLKNQMDRILSAIYGIWQMRLYAPTGKKTFCNFAVAHVARFIGYYGLENKTANDQLRVLLAGAPWEACTPTQAWALALSGFFVVAARAGNPHGHIVTIVPGGGEISAKWRAYAPACLNIGADYTIGRGTNWAFKGRPLYFALIGSYD